MAVKTNDPKFTNMKKITFILFALLAGTTFTQAQSDSGTADVNAVIVSPIQIEDGTALNFGTINGSATGGDVTVTNGGNRSFTNTDMDITSATTITAASFDITASDTYSYSINIPATTLTGAGDAMNVTFTHSRVGAAKRIGDGAAQELLVGGTLTVNDAQAAGVYQGEVEVTVAYE